MKLAVIIYNQISTFLVFQIYIFDDHTIIISTFADITTFYVIFQLFNVRMFFSLFFFIIIFWF